MPWAKKRRLVVFLVLGAIALALGVVAYFLIFYRAPSCVDGRQDGSETGPDCGGSCPYLCSVDEEPPTVLFTQALLNGEGRTDVISLVENKNQGVAAKGVPYTLAIYGFDQSLIQQLSGTLDLPPGATVPVFISGIASGHATPGAAFLIIASSTIKWYALANDPRVVPSVSNIVLAATTSPRVTAMLTNPGVRALRDVKAVVVVRDGSGNAIAASQTLLPSIPAQGRATATFSWNAVFAGTPVSLQVFPVVPLP